MSTSEFYDQFITYQINTGINERIYGLYKRLCRSGLTSASHVLEIGCGIGSLTYLLSRKINKGQIIALDISLKSIQYAKSHLTQANISFLAADILTVESDFRPVDIVLLFDVIEHIPVDQHKALFNKISHWMHDQSLLFINIPNPYHILYDQKNNPEALQEVDQPVYISSLVNVLAEVSLDITCFETYSVWVKDDYHFLIAKKRVEFSEQYLSKERNLIQKVKYRLMQHCRRLRYRYPVK
jgi:trans-aconitate 2-methyltransferase